MTTLIEERRARGLTRYTIAAAMGCSYNLVRLWETGDRRVTAEDAKKLEDLFGIPRWRIRPDLWDEPATNPYLQQRKSA